jgi:iron complex transport system substrate-binding protein
VLSLNDGRAETMLFSRPDPVLTGACGKQEQLVLLKKEDLEVLTFTLWSSLDEARQGPSIEASAI